MASIASPSPSPEASPSVDDSTTVITLPVVKHGSENKGILTFTLENTNVSIANALRRVLLSDIKTVVINTDKDNIKMIDYLDALSKKRNFDWRNLWKNGVV